MSPNLHSPHAARSLLGELDQFDEIIDVRSPAEFADDHLPGAISAPVLDNAERARIGTLYAQASAFEATRLGAALVARHIADHLETTFRDRPRSWRPLIYCWRGGKRSGAMALWLNQIGWHARQLDGGYKAWRRHVIDNLATQPAQFQYRVLTGPTGSGKTRLLHALAQAGAQVLDLESLAEHRGSLLGALPGRAQPSQRHFETRLWTRLQRFSPDRPLFVEAESRRIGRLSLPDGLLQAMHAGRCIRVTATLPDRVHFLLQDYAHLFETPDAFKQTLERLVKLHGHETVRDWQAHIDAGRREALFLALVQTHYDPAYQRSSRRHFAQATQALAFPFDPNHRLLEQAHALLEQLGTPSHPTIQQEPA